MFVASQALLAPAAPASETCDPMFVTAVRFDATIQAIEPVGKRELQRTATSDRDAEHVVSVIVDRVEPRPESRVTIEAGGVFHFEVHSPSRTFGRRAQAGSKVELEGAVVFCAGAFYRFSELHRPLPARPRPFDGTLEVGRRYRAKMRWDPGLQTGVLVGSLDMPMHQEGDISFVNPEAGPALSSEDQTGTLEFEVLSQETRLVGERAWGVLYTCRITN